MTNSTMSENSEDRTILFILLGVTLATILIPVYIIGILMCCVKRFKDKEGKRKLFAVLSFVFWIEYWIGVIIFIAWGASRQIESYTLRNGLPISAGSLMIFSLIIMLIDFYKSTERRHLKQVITNETLDELISRIKLCRPKLYFEVECFHYDEDGVEITQFSTKEEFIFDHFDNQVSQDVIETDRNSLMKIDLNVKILAGNEETKTKWKEKLRSLVSQHRKRDKEMKVKTTSSNVGIRKGMTLCLGSCRPLWLGWWRFFASTILGFLWPYRMIFLHCSGEAKINRNVLIFMSPPEGAGLDDIMMEYGLEEEFDQIWRFGPDDYSL